MLNFFSNYYPNVYQLNKLGKKKKGWGGGQAGETPWFVQNKQAIFPKKHTTEFLEIHYQRTSLAEVVCM